MVIAVVDKVTICILLNWTGYLVHILLERCAIKHITKACGGL